MPGAADQTSFVYRMITVIMYKRTMVELDTAIKVSVDGKKLFDMSKDLVWDSLQLAGQCEGTEVF